MSLVLRDVQGGVAVEHLLCLVNVRAVDANSITDAIINELTRHSLDPTHIIRAILYVMHGTFAHFQHMPQINMYY